MPAKGISSGFIAFGTYAHAVLKHLHEHGPSLSSDIRAANGWTSNVERSMTSTTICELRKYKLVYVVGRRREPGHRSFSLYDIKPPKTGNLFIPHLSHNERAAAYRKRKRIKVASVFNFRGKIEL